MTFGRVYLEPGDVGAEERGGEMGGLPIIELDEQATINWLSMGDMNVGCHGAACSEARVDVCLIADIACTLDCQGWRERNEKGASGSVS